MKKIIFASFLLLGLAAAAQPVKVDPKAVPAKVTKKFSAFYPMAAKVNWTQEGKFYTARFTDNKAKMELTIDSIGNISKKVMPIKAAEVPKNVADSILKTFPGAKMDEVVKSDASGLVIYTMEVESKAGDVYVQYSADGKMISKISEADKEKAEKEKKEKEKAEKKKKAEKKDEKKPEPPKKTESPK